MKSALTKAKNNYHRKKTIKSNSSSISNYSHAYMITKAIPKESPGVVFEHNKTRAKAERKKANL